MTAKPVPEHIDMRAATDEGLTPDQSAMKTAALAFYGEHGITAMSGTIPPQFERAIIAYAAASPASGVRVKALEWESFESTSEWAAVREWWCMYRITLRTDGLKQLRREWRDNRNDDLGTFPHWDQAKAAAQADYEAKALSALGEHP